MSFVVYQTNKKTGKKYAYLQEAFRDPVTKRPKCKRTYLGRVDPVTNQIVEKGTDGKRNCSKLGTEIIDNPVDPNLEKYESLIEEQKQIIQNLQRQLAEANKRIDELLKKTQRAAEILVGS